MTTTAWRTLRDKVKATPGALPLLVAWARTLDEAGQVFGQPWDIERDHLRTTQGGYTADGAEADRTTAQAGLDYFGDATADDDDRDTDDDLPPSEQQAILAARARSQAGGRDRDAHTGRGGQHVQVDRLGTRWMAEEDALLTMYWSVESNVALARRLGRSVSSVVSRAKFLDIASKTQRNLVKVSELERLLGYDRTTVHRAMRVLGIEPRAIVSTNTADVQVPHRGVPPEAVERLRAYFTQGPGQHTYRRDQARTQAGDWGTGGKPDACTGCERTDRPHYCKGRCRVCYKRVTRALAREAAGQQVGQPRGEQCKQARLNEAKVREMRHLRSNGAKLKELANRFGVDASTVSMVVTGKTWTHVPPETPP